MGGYRLRSLLHPNVFPVAEGKPSSLLKCGIRLAIAGLVAEDLLEPVLHVALRCDVVLRAAVPEATVDEDGDLRRSEDDIRCAPQFG